MWTIHLLDHTYLMQDMQQLHPAGTCTAADMARRDNITATLVYPLDAGLNLLTFTADDNTRAMHSWSPRCNVMVEGKQQVEKGEKASRWVVGGGEKTRRWMLQASLRMPGPGMVARGMAALRGELGGVFVAPMRQYHRRTCV